MGAIELRRKSWRVLSWVVILGLGVGMIAAVGKVTSVNGFRAGWQGIPVFLALAGAIGKVAHCKVILRGDILVVVNPLRTYIVPAVAIQDVRVGDDGTLEVRLHTGKIVSVFAFGGSLVDRFSRTSDRAAREISNWLHLHPSESASGSDSIPQINWTWNMGADISLALCVVVSGAGAIWMAFSSS